MVVYVLFIVFQNFSKIFYFGILEKFGHFGILENILFSTKDEYYSTRIKKTNYRLKPGGRKSDSQEYDDILVEFIKEGRASDLAITSSEVIFKAIQIIPEFKYKSYNSLHLWFKRFRTRNSYSIRRITKATQRLPKNVLENVSG